MLLTRGEAFEAARFSPTKPEEWHLVQMPAHVHVAINVPDSVAGVAWERNFSAQP